MKQFMWWIVILAGTVIARNEVDSKKSDAASERDSILRCVICFNLFNDIDPFDSNWRIHTQNSIDQDVCAE